MNAPAPIVSIDSGLSVTEQSRGLDWAHWLLRSIRQRCDGVLLGKLESKATAQSEWRTFIRDRFLPALGPALLQAWKFAEARDVSALIRFDQEQNRTLSKEERARSVRAADILLTRTRGARYSGALGQYRNAVDDEQATGHIVIVWAAVAHLFQLTPSVMLAEYLRLEWEAATRDVPGVPMPFGASAIDVVVLETLKASVPGEPSLLDRQEA